MGERFASGLSVLHPMGAYLEALHHTGYYYTFIGVAQIVAAIFLLIPRTVTLGALLYFPIIINIWVLSFAVRFEGSFLTSPLMVLANLYILFWNFDRLKLIFPFKTISKSQVFEKNQKLSNTFPLLFFTGVFITTGSIILFVLFGHDIMPRNSIKDCNSQFIDTESEKIGKEFCECIHTNGEPLNICIDQYERSIDS